jgi:hypothetical protein
MIFEQRTLYHPLRICIEGTAGASVLTPSLKMVGSNFCISPIEINSTTDSSRPIAIRRANGIADARRRPALTAKRGSGCHRRSSPKRPVRLGRSLDAQAKKGWLWQGRYVSIYDGSTVQLPDTPENQAAYPQVTNQQRALGFPIARIAAVFSLSCGAILDLGVCRYAGKGQSELNLLLPLLDVFRCGSVWLGDRLICSWNNFVLLQERGVEAVFRFTSNRSTGFRRGERLGTSDHVVVWPRPTSNRLFPWKQFMAIPIRSAFVSVACRSSSPVSAPKSSWSSPLKLSHSE